MFYIETILRHKWEWSIQRRNWKNKDLLNNINFVKGCSAASQQHFDWTLLSDYSSPLQWFVSFGFYAEKEKDDNFNLQVSLWF